MTELEDQQKKFNQMISELPRDERVNMQGNIVWKTLYDGVVESDWDANKMQELGDVIAVLLCHFLFICVSREGQKTAMGHIQTAILKKLDELEIEMEEIRKNETEGKV